MNNSAALYSNSANWVIENLCVKDVLRSFIYYVHRWTAVYWCSSLVKAISAVSLLLQRSYMASLWKLFS